MGKMITFLLILIFVDLLLIITGQMPTTITSTLFNALLNLSDANSGTFFRELIGDVQNLFGSGTGIASIIAGVATVAAGFFFLPTDTKLFVPMALTLATLTADFVAFYVFLADKSAILATFLMGPVIIIYIFTVVEWLKNKD